MTVNPTPAALAEDIARRAHAGQTDKAGRPYIEHVEEVVAGLPHPHNFSMIAKTAAWLHDVVEDTDWTIEDLREHGRATFLPEEDPRDHEPIYWTSWLFALKVVDALTHRPNEPRAAYYDRVKAAGQEAVAIKLSDGESNSNEDRLAKLPQSTQDRLRAKYADQRRALTT